MYWVVDPNQENTVIYRLSEFGNYNPYFSWLASEWSSFECTSSIILVDFFLLTNVVYNAFCYLSFHLNLKLSSLTNPFMWTWISFLLIFMMYCSGTWSGEIHRPSCIFLWNQQGVWPHAPRWKPSMHYSHGWIRIVVLSTARDEM